MLLTQRFKLCRKTVGHGLIDSSSTDFLLQSLARRYPSPNQRRRHSGADDSRSPSAAPARSPTPVRRAPGAPPPPAPQPPGPQRGATYPAAARPPFPSTHPLAHTHAPITAIGPSDGRDAPGPPPAPALPPGVTPRRGAPAASAGAWAPSGQVRDPPQ